LRDLKNVFLFTLVTILALIIFSGCHTPFGVYHRVKSGETLFSISRTYDVPVYRIKDANYLRSADVIHPGQRLFIPGADNPKAVKKTQKKKKPNDSNKNKRHASISGDIPVNAVKFIWPVQGVMTSGFGPRSGGFHSGIDISAPTGKPVIASAPGRVIYSSNKQRGYGNLVIIEHNSDFFTVYAHLHKRLAKEGQRIKKGEVIGQVGSTGRSTGPHLHFEIRYHKRAIDPYPLLP